MRGTLRLNHAFMTLSLVAASAACARQDADNVAETGRRHDRHTAASEPQSPRASESRTEMPAGGERVSALDEHMWIVFQARDNTRWFGSDGQGVYRFDGKTVVRFTTEHGLGGNHIRGIQEDRAGNIYVCSDPGGVSRFDGRAFSTLRAAETDPSKNVWRLQGDDLWFPGGQDTGVVYRYDGKTLHRLTFPTTKAGDDHYAELPRSKYPNAKYSPYDVYTIFKDSKGHLWFGTALLGACRYDGKSFAWVANGVNGSFGLRSIIEDKDGKFYFSNTLTRYAVDPAGPGERGTVALRHREEPGIGKAEDDFSAFMSAVKDKNGELWLATLGAGVWRWDGTRMTHYPVTDGDAPIRVYSIYRDHQDVLWLGTQEHGVYKFNGTTFEKFKV